MKVWQQLFGTTDTVETGLGEEGRGGGRQRYKHQTGGTRVLKEELLNPMQGFGRSSGIAKANTGG